MKHEIEQQLNGGGKTLVTIWSKLVPSCWFETDCIEYEVIGLGFDSDCTLDEVNEALIHETLEQSKTGL